MDSDFTFEAMTEDFLDTDPTTGITPEVASLQVSLLQSPISYGGTRYKAHEVKIRPQGMQMRVSCNSISQG
jgi:hypothetical protein